MKNKGIHGFLPGKTSCMIFLVVLCAALAACVQTQVRGQYDVVIGGVYR